jgi:hypothetical protein
MRHTAAERYDELLSSADIDAVADYARFYAVAHSIACDLSVGTPFTPTAWAYVIAAFSPLKQWENNLNIARLFRGALAVAKWRADRADFGALGAMRTRLDAAIAALSEQVPNGPKVEAFALNIAGDLRPVTIDRHMVAAAGIAAAGGSVRLGTLRELQAAVTMISPEWGMRPAETQAAIWGLWRSGKRTNKEV